MQKYLDRCEAGKTLLESLKKYAHQKNVIVLGLPRGGVPVAYEIAKALSAPLDVFIVRKLGVPDHEELAMGAIASNGVVVFNQDIINHLHISKSQIEKVIQQEEQELKRRNLKYRRNKSFPDFKNKTIILVDDGIATGATIRAAITALRQQKPASIIVAVPVAARETCEALSHLADELVCPLQPEEFYAVGAWYENFYQTSDEEVIGLLDDN